jgi:RNA polymerase sigma-70 factor, ECF subfamily
MSLNAEEESSIWMEAGLETELVVASQAGDREAFLELTRFYHRQVYRLAHAMTRDPDTAATLTQDAFIRAWQGLKSFSDRRRFLPWVLRIARNHASARARAGATVARGETAALLEAFAELRPDEQMALALRSMDRLPYSEIAVLLEFPAGATIVRVSNARGLLAARASGTDGNGA